MAQVLIGRAWGSPPFQFPFLLWSHCFLSIAQPRAPPRLPPIRAPPSVCWGVLPFSFSGLRSYFFHLLLCLKPMSCDTEKLGLYKAVDLSCLVYSSLHSSLPSPPPISGEPAPNYRFLKELLTQYPSSSLPQPNPLGHMHVQENSLLSPQLWWTAPDWAHCVNGAIESAPRGFCAWPLKSTAPSYLWRGWGNRIEPRTTESRSPFSPHGTILSVVEGTETILREKQLEGEAGEAVGQHEWIRIMTPSP